MPYFQLTYACPPLTARKLAQLESQAFAWNALSITLLDAEDQPILEPGPGDTPLWDKLFMRLLFETATLSDRFERLIEKHPKWAHFQRVERIEIADQPWERAWLAHFKPIDCGHGLWICPTAYEPPDPQGRIVYLDPGLAFGTGTHPTTALCLEWLAAQDLHQKTVIDYGCGSGILSLAAYLQGARAITAIDIDPQALISTRANIQLNQFPEMAFTCQLPTEMADPQRTEMSHPQHADMPHSQSADLVMANILQGPLLNLAETFRSLLSPSGMLLLSGLLDFQKADILERYTQLGFQLQEITTRTINEHETWCCMVFQR